MNAQKRKSKKRSEPNSNQQPSDFVFYLDRNLGNHVIADALREVGEQVEIHDDHLPPDAPDEDWISLVGKKGWIAVTKDKNIRYRIGEIESVRNNGAKVIVVRAKDATGSEIGSVLVRFREKIKKYASRTPPPFIAGLDRWGSIKDYPT